MHPEQTILRHSIAATLCVAALGIGFEEVEGVRDRLDLSSRLRRPPNCSAGEHGVENDQELAHAGGDGKPPQMVRRPLIGPLSRANGVKSREPIHARKRAWTALVMGR